MRWQERQLAGRLQTRHYASVGALLPAWLANVPTPLRRKRPRPPTGRGGPGPPRAGLLQHGYSLPLPPHHVFLRLSKNSLVIYINRQQGTTGAFPARLRSRGSVSLPGGGYGGGKGGGPGGGIGTMAGAMLSTVSVFTGRLSQG